MSQNFKPYYEILEAEPAERSDAPGLGKRGSLRCPKALLAPKLPSSLSTLTPHTVTDADHRSEEEEADTGIRPKMESGSSDPVEDLGTMADVEPLKRAWRNEKAAPEILRFEKQLIDRVSEQIQLMVLSALLCCC